MSWDRGRSIPRSSWQCWKRERGSAHTPFPPCSAPWAPSPQTPGHPCEGCGLGLAPWGRRSRKPFPRVFQRRISEGSAPRGGDTQTEGLPRGISPDPPRPGRGGGCGSFGGSQQTAIAACSGGARLGLSAAPCPLPIPRGRARRGQRARPSVCPSVRPSPPRRGVPPAAATGGLRAARGAAGLPLRELPVREHAPPPGSRVGKGCPGPVPIPGGLASCLGVRTALRTWGERRRAACEPCCSSRGFYSLCPRLATRVGSDLLSPPASPPRAMLCLILHF